MKTTAFVFLFVSFCAGTLEKAMAEMRCEPDARTNSPSSQTQRAKLHRDLLCQYDTRIQSQKSVNVSLGMYIRRAKVVDTTLVMDALVYVEWKDPFLVWDPTRYEDITEINILGEKIWNPEIVTIVTLPWERDGMMQKSLWPAVCSVSSNGTVRCASSLELGGDCEMNGLHWPHIHAQCVVYLGTDFRTEMGIHMIFANETEKVEMDGYIPDNDWVVTEIKREYLEMLESQALTFTVRLRSRGAVISTALLGPAAAFSVILVATFCFPLSSQLRIKFGCCSILGIVLSCAVIFERLPPIGGTKPIVVTVYSTLLILACLAVIIPVPLSLLVPTRGKQPATPRWLYTFRTWLINSTTGKALLTMLFLTPISERDNQAHELMPAFHMQAGESSDSGNILGTEDDEADGDDVAILPPADTGSGPHTIREFFVSLVDRCLLILYAVICLSLFGYLIHGLSSQPGTEEFTIS